MIYLLNNPDDRAEFVERVRGLLGDGKAVAVDLTEKRPPRSTQQNRYLHALLGYFSRVTGYTEEEAKQQIFKRLCNPDIFVRRRRVKINGVSMTGARLTLRSTTELASDELSLAITRFRNWSSLNAGIYLPAPDEGWEILKIERDNSRSSEYKQTTTEE